MKIAFFSSTLKMGGYEKVVIEYANYIADNTEHEVSIVCCSAEGDLESIIHPSVNIVDLHCRTRSLIGSLITFFKNEKTDIFYSGFRICNTIAVLARELSGSKNTKVCISQHGFEYKGVIENLFHTVVQRRADGFVAVTESLKEYETTSLHLKCRSIVVGNPVISEDAALTPIQDVWLEDDIPTICVCGRLSKDKNVKLALNILLCLHRQEYRYKLAILGNGPEAEQLKQYTDEIGMIPYVKFYGYIEKPMNYMSKCSVYLHTCDREGFGNTVIEAMYTGLPIVTTACGGPEDIIEKGKYGVCFGNGRANDAAERGAEAIIYATKKQWSKEELQLHALDFTASNNGPRLLNFFAEME